MPDVLGEHDGGQGIALGRVHEHGQHLARARGDPRRDAVGTHPHRFERVARVARYAAPPGQFRGVGGGQLARVVEDGLALQHRERALREEPDLGGYAVGGRGGRFAHQLAHARLFRAAHEGRVRVVGEQPAQLADRALLRPQRQYLGGGRVCVRVAREVAVRLRELQTQPPALHRPRQSEHRRRARQRALRVPHALERLALLVRRGVHRQRERVAPARLAVRAHAVQNAVHRGDGRERQRERVGEVVRVGRVRFPERGKIAVQRAGGRVGAVAPAVDLPARYVYVRAFVRRVTVCRAVLRARERGIRRPHRDVRPQLLRQRRRAPRQRDQKHDQRQRDEHRRRRAPAPRAVRSF